MITHSRRLAFFTAFTVVFLVLTFVHLRTSWTHSTLNRASNYYDKFTDYFHHNESHNATIPSPDRPKTAKQAAHAECANFPDTDGALLVMKTGATEAFDKIPTHLLTTLRCLPDFLLFSDMEQSIGPYRIHDALSEIGESTKAYNADFDLYRFQQECPVTQQACHESQARNGNEGWVLDKYKFLPMMERTWRMRPGLDWYIFAEADTYVFWANMVHWLKEKAPVAPNGRVLFGSQSFIGGTPFAHGGSGYVLSGALLQHLIEDHPGVVEQYSKQGAHECCGDLLLAMALAEYEGVKIRNTWPMINGEKPNTLPYGPRHWCEPLLTMHHVNSEEISAVWQYEQSREGTILIKDMFDHFIKPVMQETRQDWDNLSDDVCYLNPDPDFQEKAENVEKDRQKSADDMTSVEKEAWESWQNCAKVCKNEGGSSSPEGEDGHEDSGNTEEKRWDPIDRQCFQYRWHDGVCCTSKSFKLGVPKSKPEDNSKDKWVSGWYLRGIKDWIEAKGECTEPAWKEPDPN